MQPKCRMHIERTLKTNEAQTLRTFIQVMRVVVNYHIGQEQFENCSASKM